MKKLFLLTGMLFAFVLVQAMGVNEPPGLNYEKSVVCNIDLQINDAVCVNYVNYDAATPDFGFGYIHSTFDADVSKEVVFVADYLSCNNYSDISLDRGQAVVRSGVIKSNVFLSDEPNLTLKFKAKARSWIYLTADSFKYESLQFCQLNNFDGNPLRFY